MRIGELTGLKNRSVSQRLGSIPSGCMRGNG